MTGWDWLGLIGVLMVGGSIAIALLAVINAILGDVRAIIETRARLRQPTPLAEPVGLDDVQVALHSRPADLRMIRGGRDDCPRGVA